MLLCDVQDDLTRRLSLGCRPQQTGKTYDSLSVLVRVEFEIKCRLKIIQVIVKPEKSSKLHVFQIIFYCLLELSWKSNNRKMFRKPIDNKVLYFNK